MRSTSYPVAGQRISSGVSRGLDHGSPVVIAAAAALLLGVSACSTTAAEPEEAPTPSSQVMMPGKPGEEASAVDPEDFDGVQSQEDEWNDADREFMTMMIMHHAQALEMTDLVPARSDSEQLETFSNRMHLAQKGEIGYMADWLEERELSVPEEASVVEEGDIPSARPHDHGDAPMPGMLTDQEISAMAEAEGDEFDRLFLEGMIKHHEGALEMTDGVQLHGVDLTTQELAGHIASDQRAEISRLQDLLEAL